MAKKQNTLINGIAYSYVDMSITIEGLGPSQYVDGFVGIPIQSISYSANQQKTANYANSKYATSYSYGKVEFSGSISFTLDSMEYLRDKIFENFAESRSILDLPASTITITFSNKGKTNVHSIKNVIFTTENTDGSEGDDQFSVSCDFIASFINYGDASTLGLGTVGAVIATASPDNQL